MSKLLQQQELKPYDFTYVLYQFERAGEELTSGTTYNEDFDKYLTTKEFKNIRSAIKYAKENILKNHKINSIEDSAYEGESEYTIFFGDLKTIDGETYEQGLRIHKDGDGSLTTTLQSLLVNGA